MENLSLEELTIKYFEVDRELDKITEAKMNFDNEWGKLSSSKWEIYKIIREKQILQEIELNKNKK